MEKDYYKILGVPKNSSFDEIKRAYHILASQYHPDKNNGNENRFKEVAEAYRVLSNSESRRKYDTNYKTGSSTKTNNESTARSSNSQNSSDSLKNIKKSAT